MLTQDEAAKLRALVSIALEKTNEYGYERGLDVAHDSYAKYTDVIGREAESATAALKAFISTVTANAL